MNDLRIAFFVDAGDQIGTGHLARCLTLADYCIKSNHHVAFYLFGDNISYLEQIKSKGFKVYLHKVKFEKHGSKVLRLDSLGDESSETVMYKFLLNFQPNICLGDSYYLDENWSCFIKKYVNKVGFIDDLGNRRLGGDFLLDQNPDASRDKYVGLIGKNTVTMFGSKYAIISSQFKNLREESIRNKLSKKMNHIFINFGGSDPENFTEKTVKALLYYPKINKFKLTIVCGSAYRFQNSLSKLLNDSMLSYEYIFDTDKMADLMAASDLAIGAGGTTSLERCCMGLPTLQFILSDNQRLGTHALASVNAVKHLTNFHDIGNILSEINKNVYLSMVYSGLKLVDGNGALKVVEKLEALVDN